MRVAWAIGVVVAALVSVGCGGDRPASSSAQSATNASTRSPWELPHLYLDHAQPKLPTLKLWLGPAEVVAEIARRPTEIATGMMYREKLGEDEGMLFVFERPHRTSFYMRNTKVPLSCAYIDPQGAIREIHDLKPLDETPVEASTDEIQYVLEVNQGWFQRHGVTTGMVVRTEIGSLAETFFPSRK